MSYFLRKNTPKVNENKYTQLTRSDDFVVSLEDGNITIQSSIHDFNFSIIDEELLGEGNFCCEIKKHIIVENEGNYFAGLIIRTLQLDTGTFDIVVLFIDISNNQYHHTNLHIKEDNECVSMLFYVSLGTCILHFTMSFPMTDEYVDYSLSNTNDLHINCENLQDVLRETIKIPEYSNSDQYITICPSQKYVETGKLNVQMKSAQISR